MQLLDDAKGAMDSGDKESGRKDLLSLLVQSNMSEEIPESQRLSDAVVVARAYPFLSSANKTHNYLRAPDFFCGRA